MTFSKRRHALQTIKKKFQYSYLDVVCMYILEKLKEGEKLCERKLCTGKGFTKFLVENLVKNTIS